MIPSKNWFPGSMQERAAWFQNFATQFAAIAAALGFLPADVATVQDDNSVIQFLADAQMQFEAWADAFRQYRILITEGAIGVPTPDFPDNLAFALPNVVATGIYQRLIELVDRIRAATAYTDEIGALLGIIPSTSGPGSNIPTTELKPVIKVSQSLGDYKFDVNVTRLGQEAFKIQIQRSGESTWTDAAFATKNPCHVTATPTTPGQPERILVRAILLADNEPVGEPSDPTYVTLNP
jgi:hypothetical protein